MLDDEVLEFINRRFKSSEADWLDGNCYYMALILTARFPLLEIYYEPIEGHFLAGINNTFYDASGKRTNLCGSPILFDDLKIIDPILAERITRDCIW